MERKHQSKFYDVADMRHLQAQVNELWEQQEKMNAGAVNVRSDVDHDAVAAETLAEATRVMQPDAYEMRHHGCGWWQVTDSLGEPIHKGRLRKDAALKMCKKAVQTHE